MNDLVVSLDRSKRNDDLNASAYAASIAVSDFSFQQIVAAFEPWKSILGNRNLIADISPLHMSGVNSLILSNNIPGASYLFFGNVSFRGTQDDPFEVDVLRLITPGPQGTASFTKHHAQASGNGRVNSVIKNSFIQMVDTGDPATYFDVFGILITLKGPIDFIPGVPFDFPQTQVADWDWTDDRGIRRSANTLDPWDQSGAPRIFIDLFKPAKVGNFFGVIDPIATSPYTYITGVPGTVIPKNFFNFLQYVYAELVGGAPYAVPTNPSATVPPNSVAALITDIVVQMREKPDLVTLGDNRTNFVLPSYEYNSDQSIQLGLADSKYSAFALLTPDPEDKNRTSFTRIQSNGALVGRSKGVVTFGFPALPRNAEGSTDILQVPLSVDLVSFSLPAVTIGIIPGTIGAGKERQLLPLDYAQKTYSSAFNYPNVDPNIIP